MNSKVANYLAIDVSNSAS